MKDETGKEKSKVKVSEASSDKTAGKVEAKKIEDNKKAAVEMTEKTAYKISGKNEDSISTSSNKGRMDKQNKKEPMLKKLDKSGPGKSVGMLVGTVLVVLLGIGSGWFLSGSSSAKQTTSMPEAEVVEENGKSVGMPMQEGEEEFDEAEGILEEGGIDGEGTHHLVREGGESKYVYLTSLTLDLQSFVGKTVLVKGETMASQSAPWLMDVWVIKELE